MMLVGWAVVVAVAASALARDPSVCPEAGIRPGVPSEATMGLDWWVVRPPSGSAADAGPRPSDLDWLKPIETHGSRPGGAPILSARSGWGRAWVGRGALPAELLKPWSIESLVSSEEGGWNVTVQRGNVEQGATTSEVMSVADVLRAPTGGSGGNDTARPPPYLAEDSALLGRSRRLKAASEAVAEAVTRAGLGSAAAMVRLTMLWAGRGGALSGLHSDADPTNALAQLAGVKDVWVFHPLDTAALGASEKFDLGARLASVDGFKLWRPKTTQAGNEAAQVGTGAAADRTSFAAGDVCAGLNTVTSLGADDAGHKEQLVDCEPWTDDQSGTADGTASPAVGQRLRGVLHVRLFPGDVLLIPQGWMHMAMPRSPGVSLSVRPLSPGEVLQSIPMVLLSVLHDAGLYRVGDCACHL